MSVKMVVPDLSYASKSDKSSCHFGESGRNIGLSVTNNVKLRPDWKQIFLTKLLILLVVILTACFIFACALIKNLEKDFRDLRNKVDSLKCPVLDLEDTPFERNLESASPREVLGLSFNLPLVAGRTQRAKRAVPIKKKPKQQRRARKRPGRRKAQRFTCRQIRDVCAAFRVKPAQEASESPPKENITSQSTRIEAVHLKGGLPELLIKEKGIIGPWFHDKWDTPTPEQPSFMEELQNSTVTVLKEGLYLLYAQVYYLSSGNSSSSYSVVRSGRAGEVLATCSSSSLAGETSCFTATARRLNPGDQLFLRERQSHRRVLFRDGQTFLGLVLLATAS